MLLEDTKECRQTEKCPVGYKSSTPGACSRAASELTVAIVVQTLNADGTQPQDKNLNLQVDLSHPFANATYSWQITKVASASSTASEISFASKLQIM